MKISLSFYVFSLSLQILYGQHGKELSEIYLHLGIDYIGGLVTMYFLPGFTVGEHMMRRVDLLGDVRTQKELTEEPDSLLPPPPKVKPAFVDTCRAGMTCIEDYSDSTLRGMTPFYRALDELTQRPRQVRIAVFGDSFIEADILTADLRSMLQDKYGGCGVGFVTITSMTSGFRPPCATRLVVGKAIL